MSERRRSSRRLKVVLALLVLAGSMSFLTVSGTYALFTSEERDAGGTSASGTLTLGAAANGSATSCFSYGSGSTANANPACPALMSSSSLQYPGQTLSATVTLTDNGSVGGRDLTLYMPTCTQTTSPSAAVVGGGNPCVEITDGTPATADGLEMTIEETNSTGTVLKCWYPVIATGTCTSNSGWAAAAPNSFPIFAEYVTSASVGYDLGAGPTPGSPRYFKVSVIVPTEASNTLQGEEAVFGLTWHLTT